MSISKIIVGVLFLGMVGFTYYTYQSKNQTINKVSDSLEVYKDKYQRAVFAQNATTVNKSQINEIAKDNDSLKSIIKDYKNRQVTTITRINTIIEHDTITVPMVHDTSASLTKSDSIFHFDYREKQQLILNGIVNVPDKDISIHELTVKNRQDVLIDRANNIASGYRSYKIHVVNSNPHVVVTNIQSYQLDIKKKWYEKWYIVAPAGFIAGALIVKL